MSPNHYCGILQTLSLQPPFKITIKALKKFSIVIFTAKLCVMYQLKDAKCSEFLRATTDPLQFNLCFLCTTSVALSLNQADLCEVYSLSIFQLLVCTVIVQFLVSPDFVKMILVVANTVFCQRLKNGGLIAYQCCSRTVQSSSYVYSYHFKGRFT